jgi:hypothetical protein
MLTGPAGRVTHHEREDILVEVVKIDGALRWQDFGLDKLEGDGAIVGFAKQEGQESLASSTVDRTR